MTTMMTTIMISCKIHFDVCWLLRSFFLHSDTNRITLTILCWLMMMTTMRMMVIIVIPVCRSCSCYNICVSNMKSEPYIHIYYQSFIYIKKNTASSTRRKRGEHTGVGSESDNGSTGRACQRSQYHHTCSILDLDPPLFLGERNN